MEHLNPVRYDNAIPSSSCMEGATKKQKFFIPLRRTELTGIMSGPISQFTTIQTFSFTRAECPETVDAIYRFPLPGDTAIDSVSSSFGGNEVVSKLMERKKAEEEFDTAKKEGRQSLLISRESPDVFTMFLAGIKPDEEVKVQTTFVQMGDPQGVGFEFRIPLTTSPRFVRGDEIGSRHANGQPLLPMIDPGHRFSMDVEINGSGSVDCTSFRTESSSTGHLSLLDGEVIPDRDLVFRWTPVQGEVPSVQVLTDNDRHFLAVITPPKRPRKLRPREITLLLDRSGSMEGAKWEATTWTAERLLNSLLPDDRFNLCLFHNTTRWLFDRPGSASKQNLRKAQEFLKLDESGGTELGMAIEQALDQAMIDDEAVKHVIIVTDAEVSDSGRIVRTVKDKRMGRNCSVICIDSAPNSFLARKIAHVGEGVAKFLTSSPEEKDLSTALDDIMEEWAAPISDSLVLITDRAACDSEKGRYLKQGKDEYFMPVPPTPSGQSNVILGSFRTKGIMHFKCISKGPDNGEGEELAVKTTETSVVGLNKLYGAAMINKLELLGSSEYDLESIGKELELFGMKLAPGWTVESIYHGNKNKNARNEMRDLIVKTSLRYKVPCAETAFLGVRKEKGRAATKVVLVPNALGEGWADSFAFGNSGIVKSKRSIRSNPPDAHCFYCPAPAQKVRDRPNGNKEPMVDVEFDQGLPEPENGELLIFDGLKCPIPKLSGLLSRVMVNAPGLEATELLIFVGDLSTARVRIRLRDMEDGQLDRPINVRIGTGERVLIKLVGVDKTMGGSAFKLVIT